MGKWSDLTAQQKAAVIEFAMDNGVSDINSIRDTYNLYSSEDKNEYSEGGGIHIKHPGRLTALKERTGKTEAELWATGNAHTRKMITFARNARKWHKHDQATTESLSDPHSGYLTTDAIQQYSPKVVEPKRIVPLLMAEENAIENPYHLAPSVVTNYNFATDPVAKSVADFFANDVYPRYKKTHPLATKKEIAAVKQAYRPDIFYEEAGNEAILGSHYGENDITYNPLYILSGNTMVHELTHRYRQDKLTPTFSIFGDKRWWKWNTDKVVAGGYNTKEQEFLNAAYDMTGTTMGGYPELWEKGTTNTEARYKIWRDLQDKLGRTPSLEETDKYIDELPDEKLLDYYINGKVGTADGVLLSPEYINGYMTHDFNVGFPFRATTPRTSSEVEASNSAGNYLNSLYLELENKTKNIQNDSDLTVEEKDKKIKELNSEYSILIEKARKNLDETFRNKTGVDRLKEALKNVAHNVNTKEGKHLASTGGPLYPFSFQKNPYLKTPNVRYADGGNIGHQYGFGDWLRGLFDKNSKEEQAVESAGLDYGELKRRQAYTESGFDNTAKSKAGATGMFQIMPATLADYNKANGTAYTQSDLLNQDTNTTVRDWFIDSISKRPWVTKGGANDSVQFGKILAGYNYGAGNTVTALNNAKAAGVDIYNGWDWLDYMPQETQDYVNFILRNQNNSISRNDSAYKAASLLKKNEVSKLK